MFPPESPEQNAAGKQAERIRKLVESGEAINERDAQEAMKEENWVEYFRGLERERVVAAMRADIAELDRRWANRETEPLSPEDEHDRYDLRFQLAIVKTAADVPDERESLLYQQFLDIIGNDLGTDTEREVNERTQRRLHRKADTIRERIGRERASELLDLYRIHLQELMSEF